MRWIRDGWQVCCRTAFREWYKTVRGRGRQMETAVRKAEVIDTAVMGYGTIGSGVVEILERNRDEIINKTGKELRLKYVLDLRDFPGSPVEDKVVHDLAVIVDDPEVKIVVETMGGVHPAYEFVRACLLAGKHVATSNKALVAACGSELLKIAREKQVNFMFEASTGGGIPVIRTMYRCMNGEKIQEITGILNGTTNYILTKMDRFGETFETALKEAQDLGYAERNPEADVEGHDTCRKLAILTAMATGKEVDYQDIPTEGITAVTDVDFKYAERLGKSVKLLGSSRIAEGQVTAFVAPVMIGPENPLFSVNDVYNGIVIKGNMLGVTMLYGSGAGKLPTASAVVADMIEAAQFINENIPLGWIEKKQPVEPLDHGVFRYFVRIRKDGEDAVRAAEAEMGPAEVVTLEEMPEFALLTEPMTEAEFNRKKAALVKRLEDRSAVLQVIRAE